jgi:prephenate dehydratase
LAREIETAGYAFREPDRELADTDACVATLAGRRPLVEARRIAVLGPPGTFSDVAVRQYAQALGISVAPAYFRTIADVFDAVRNCEAPLGLIPVENMIEGSVTVSLDRLFETGLKVSAELLVPIHHSVSVLPGTQPSAIQRVLSMPMALAQVRGWLSAHAPQAKLVETPSTAEAIAQVARQRYEGDAAVGLASTAEAAGLEVLARDIEDEKGNVTRFFVVGQDDAPPSGNDRTSLCVHQTKNRPGALDQVLGVLAKHGLNLSKIESRPTRKRLGEYRFYIDVEGHRLDDAVVLALDELSRENKVTVLGSYPRAF